MDLTELLTSHALFSHLSRSAIYRLVALAQIKTFQAGELILQEGKISPGCFIILTGEVEVIKEFKTVKSKKIAILGKGEILGEMAMIDDQPHSATVRALQETQCIMIERWDFKAQMQAYPEIALQLLPILAKRLRKVLEQQEGNYVG